MRPTDELEQSIRASHDPSILDSDDLTPPNLPEYLHALLADHGLTVAQAITRCNLDRSYGYQLFNGKRRPPRNVLLTLSLHLGLTEPEVQRLLKLSGRPVLYARNRRDAAVLYALSHHLTLAETEDLLTRLEVDPLGANL